MSNKKLLARERPKAQRCAKSRPTVGCALHAPAGAALCKGLATVAALRLTDA